MLTLPNTLEVLGVDSLKFAGNAGEGNPFGHLTTPVPTTGNIRGALCYALSQTNFRAEGINVSFTITKGQTLPDEFLCYVRNIRSVELAPSITALGVRSLGYTSLHNIHIQGLISTVYERAFSDNYDLVDLQWRYLGSDLGNKCLWGCTKLNDILIPKRVTSISDGAFQYCYGMHALTLSGALETISDDAFLYCCNIETVRMYQNNQAKWETDFKPKFPTASSVRLDQLGTGDTRRNY